MFFSKKAALLGALFVLPVGCKTAAPASDVLVSEVPHTESKSQAIGNCWIYATAGWLESMWLAYNAETIDVAESYWTWWHWYGQIVGSDTLTKIVEGGNWGDSQHLILKYGWVAEADFAEKTPKPAVDSPIMTSPMSPRDKAALDYINAALQPGGSLATLQSRTPQNVRRELDKAFDVNMSETETKRRSADQTILKAAARGGQDASVAALLPGWQILFVTSPQQIDSALARVKKALNSHLAIPMSYFVAAPALNSAQNTFSNSLLEDAKRKANGQPIPGGGHLVVISDYSVKDVPGVGQIGFGEVSAELKEKALSGKLDAFKIKNSWGVAQEHYIIELDYLLNTVQTEYGPRMVLSHFVLPPGY